MTSSNRFMTWACKKVESVLDCFSEKTPKHNSGFCSLVSQLLIKSGASFQSSPFHTKVPEVKGGYQLCIDLYFDICTKKKPKVQSAVLGLGLIPLHPAGGLLLLDIYPQMTLSNCTVYTTFHYKNHLPSLKLT